MAPIGGIGIILSENPLALGPTGWSAVCVCESALQDYCRSMCAPWLVIRFSGNDIEMGVGIETRTLDIDRAGSRLCLTSFKSRAKTTEEQIKR